MNAYRRGDLRPLLTGFARACLVAASESGTTAERLLEIPAGWRDQVGPVRAGSAVEALLAALPVRPVISSDEACALVDAPRSGVFAAIARLREAGVLRPLTDRQRDQIGGAGAVLDELDDLSIRIAAASR